MTKFLIRDIAITIDQISDAEETRYPGCPENTQCPECTQCPSLTTFRLRENRDEFIEVLESALEFLKELEEGDDQQ